MSWEVDITEALHDLENCGVRYDVSQSTTSTQRNRAKNNIGFESPTATQIENNDYRITMSL